MLNGNGYEIPEWRIEANEKQLRFASIMTGIVGALEAAGHTGWTVEHVTNSPEDVAFNAGLQSYYGTCTLKCTEDFKLYGKRVEGYNIHLWMSEKRGEKDRKGYFSVSHRELEKYSKDSDESIKVGIDITKSPERIAAEIIRRVIFPARLEHAELDARRCEDIHRRSKIVLIADSLRRVTHNQMTIETSEDRMRDKNTGAEFRYYVHKKINVEGSISHYGETVDLTIKSMTPEQAQTLLSIIASTVPAPYIVKEHDSLIRS